MRQSGTGKNLLKPATQLYIKLEINLGVTFSNLYRKASDCNLANNNVTASDLYLSFANLLFNFKSLISIIAIEFTLF